MTVNERHDERQNLTDFTWYVSGQLLPTSCMINDGTYTTKQFSYNGIICISLTVRSDVGLSLTGHL